MKKQLLGRFVSKYFLGGLTGEVVWAIENGALQVRAMHERKYFIADVTWCNATDEDDTEFTIKSTHRLLRFLKVCSEDISLKLQKDESGAVKALIFNEDVEIQTGSLDDSEVSSLKQAPPYNIQIQLNNDFRRLFSKSLMALGSKSLFTIRKSPQTNLIDVVLGPSYRDMADLIAIHVDAVEYNSAENVQRFFSGKALKEILDANSECQNPILKISDVGIASISFSDADLTAEYHLFALDVGQQINGAVKNNEINKQQNGQMKTEIKTNNNTFVAGLVAERKKQHLILGGIETLLIQYGYEELKLEPAPEPQPQPANGGGSPKGPRLNTVLVNIFKAAGKPMTPEEALAEAVKINATWEIIGVKAKLNGNCSNANGKTPTFKQNPDGRFELIVAGTKTKTEEMVSAIVPQISVEPTPQPAAPIEMTPA